MSDEYGFDLAKKRGMSLGDIGHQLLQETDEIRVWSVDLEPGESIHFHYHHHPYVIISLGGDKNVVESIFGEKRETVEPAGNVVYRNAPSPVHRLTNISQVPYRSRLVEFKNVGWGEGEGLLPLGRALVTGVGAVSAPPKPENLPNDVMDAFKEVIIQTADLGWVDKSLSGLSHKALWHNEETEASIALVKFEKGAGIPDSHAHASNQFMYCLSGRYRYIPTGTTLTPGSFYWNPKGSVHGPTLAEETTVLLEIYDGPHYPQRPNWYDNDEDAR
ncbi:MAG TPA: cupin domain-containing protein [Trueperaceae bacterium]|nr:cupin domain-containing protein [Trueperaceae bacterium]